jgi:hypothetical protein
MKMQKKRNISKKQKERKEKNKFVPLHIKEKL